MWCRGLRSSYFVVVNEYYGMLCYLKVGQEVNHVTKLEMCNLFIDFFLFL
jgi:hypothetical protein